MDGILNINKPSGITSFGVVALVRRLSGERRVGHAGTLDPAATGVLPVCLGQGTRVIEFLVDTTKSYRAEIELGAATDTYDAMGKVTQQEDFTGISRAQLEVALASFRGQIEQVPPIYSALKHQGSPLYELARAGLEVELKSRPVTIHKLDLIDFQTPSVTIEVVCSKGTYIRSIAHDLGQILGCGAHLKNLIRLRCGIFDIKDAVSVSQLEDALRGGNWQQFLYPIDSVLSGLPTVVVSDDEGKNIKNGRCITLESGRMGAVGNNLQPAISDETSLQNPDETSLQNRCRAYTLDGSFLGVLRFNPEDGQWYPQKVFLRSVPVLE